MPPQSDGAEQLGKQRQLKVPGCYGGVAPEAQLAELAWHLSPESKWLVLKIVANTLQPIPMTQAKGVADPLRCIQ